MRVVIPGLERVCDWWYDNDEQWRFLQFLGFWLGDGSLGVQSGSVLLHQKTPAAIEWLDELMSEVFPRWCNRYLQPVTGYKQSRGSVVYSIRCPPLYNYLRLMAVGPLGYNPRDRAALRSYPHFTKDEGLAAEEQQSVYYKPDNNRGFGSMWTEEEMLAAMKLGPEICWSCGGGESTEDKELMLDDDDLPSDEEAVDEEGNTVRIRMAYAVVGDEKVVEALRAQGKAVWCYQQPLPWLVAPGAVAPVFDVVNLAVLPPLPPPVPNPNNVPIPAGAAFVPWNHAWWILINGHWYSLKRWLGSPQQIANVYSRLSKAQAIALLDGFCRADGQWETVQYDDDGEPTGQWRCSGSSFPLIDHLQLIGQLAGAAVDLHLAVEGGTSGGVIDGRLIQLSVDHWALSFSFSNSGRKRVFFPFPTAPLAQPVDVSEVVDERGYYQYEDDGRVYCLEVEDNSNFLTQRLSHKRGRKGDSVVRAHSLFIGNCMDTANKCQPNTRRLHSTSLSFRRN